MKLDKISSGVNYVSEKDFTIVYAKAMKEFKSLKTTKKFIIKKNVEGKALRSRKKENSRN